MKRTLLLSAGLVSAIGLSAFGIAQAAGNGGGAGGGNASGGSAMQTQSQERTRAEYNYRHEYRYGEDDGEEYGDKLQTRDRTQTQTRTGWISVDEAVKGLEGAGYKVRAMKTERYRYEAKVTASDGTPLELKLDPATGAIVETELD